MREMLRLVARLVATPIFILAFGMFWVGFVVFIGSAFAFFSFLSKEEFDWKDHIKDCNEFFTEPLVSLWGLEKPKP